MEETYWFACTIVRETAKAWLVNDGTEEEHWIPKSQVLDSEEDLGEGVSTSIEIPQWLAEKKGLEV